MTVSAVFPAEGAWGNILKYYDWTRGAWVDVTGRGTYSNNGTYTIPNLIPGVKYYLSMRYYTTAWYGIELQISSNRLTAVH